MVEKSDTVSILYSNRVESPEITFELDVVPTIDLSGNEMERRISKGLADTEELIANKDCRLAELNSEIDKLTSHADGIDCMVAVGSGILAGIVDSFFVGKFSFENAQNWGQEKVDGLLKKITKKDNIEDAVRELEKNEIAADKVTNAFGGGRQHHLRDFSHHASPVGLFFSFLTQFTKCVYGTNTAGIFQVVPLGDDALYLIGKDFPEKITFGVVNWVLHMLSDIAGSSTSRAMGSMGTGVPGPIMSFLKEISALPIFSKLNADGYKEFSVMISKLFNGTLVKGVQFDLRTELGILHELGKQAIPVIINECIVRGFYFIRRLCWEIKEKRVNSLSMLREIDWAKTLPFKNRTIIRMLTISTGTFTAVDAADAAIRSAAESGGVPAAFLSNFLLRINFVGIGRFAVAIACDLKMGADRRKRIADRALVMNERLYALNAKVFYKQAQMWISAENTAQSIDLAIKTAERAWVEYNDSFVEISGKMESISESLGTLQENDPELAADIKEILLWG